MNEIRREIARGLSVQAQPDGCHVEWDVPLELPVWPDHFPAESILPGVCLLQATLLALAQARACGEIKLLELKNAKFTAPVKPGDKVSIDATWSAVGEGDWLVQAKVRTPTLAAAQFSLRVREMTPGQGATA